MIARIDGVERRGALYTVHWTDDRGKRGSTMGSVSSAHVHALVTRAKREGVYASGNSSRDPKKEKKGTRQPYWEHPRTKYEKDILDLLAARGSATLNSLTPDHLDAALRLQKEGRIERAGANAEGRTQYRLKKASPHSRIARGKRDPISVKAKSAPGRLPSPRYYRSGSSHARYKRPAAKILNALKVDRVTHTSGRGWLVEFKEIGRAHV